MSLQQDTDHNEQKFLHKFVDLTDRRVLEVGCGEGRLTWQYVSKTRLMVGVDLDRDSLRVARVDCPSDAKDILHLACADSTHLPFAKEKFDIAILAWSL
jgi:ubiquinone/menaquinone biosynthesis C-methylase UbiE